MRHYATVGRVTLFHGDAADARSAYPPGRVSALISDVPYGMGYNTDSTRFTGGSRIRGAGRSDLGPVLGDDEPFDPAPWIGYRHVCLWGANHYAARLPVGTTLVWIKKAEANFETFLSDAEIGWVKGGHGVYCRRISYPPPVRLAESGTRKSVHPTQKPVALMEWSMERAGVGLGARVLDPYAGSGTTGVACLRTGRAAVLVELEERYCEVAARRLERELATLNHADG